MKLLIAFVTVVALIEAFPLAKEIKDLWEAYKANHGKSYTTEEDESRLQMFLETKDKIDAHNKLYSEGKFTYTMAVNHLADLTVEEKAKMRGGSNLTAILSGRSRQLYQSRGFSSPDSIDWRDYGYVTGVKNQGSCGGCWAFATTGAVEGQHFRYTGQLISLSEQQLIDCNSPRMDCAGGWADTAFDYIKNIGGIETEEEYPYEEATKECRWNGHAAATVKGYVDCPWNDEVTLKEMVAENGPVAVNIDASKDGFAYYSSGVYNDPICNIAVTDHVVLVVGYGTQDGQDYWIVKNSWGEGYGHNGYMLMARGVNQCGIGTAASYPLV